MTNGDIYMYNLLTANEMYLNEYLFLATKEWNN